jgi:hypothetical protein
MAGVLREEKPGDNRHNQTPKLNTIRIDRDCRLTGENRRNFVPHWHRSKHAGELAAYWTLPGTHE